MEKQIKRIDYLDLEIIKHERIIEKSGKFKHTCHFNNNFKHDLHTDNTQLNSLIDLTISMAEKLDYLENKNKNIWEAVLLNLKNKNKIIKEFNQRLSEIEELNKYVLNKIQNKEKREETQEITIEKIDKHTEKIEHKYEEINILIKEIKEIILQ